MLPLVPILLTGGIVGLTAYLGSKAGQKTAPSPAPAPPAPGPGPGPAPAPPAPAPEPGPEPLPHEEPSAAGVRTGQFAPPFPGAPPPYSFGSGPFQWATVRAPTLVLTGPGGGAVGQIAPGDSVVVDRGASGPSGFPGSSGWCLIRAFPPGLQPGNPRIVGLIIPTALGGGPIEGWVPCSALAPTYASFTAFPNQPIVLTESGFPALSFLPSLRPGGRPHPFFRGSFHRAPGAITHPAGRGFGAPAQHPAAPRVPFARPPSGSVTAHAPPVPQGSAFAHAGPAAVPTPASRFVRPVGLR